MTASDPGSSARESSRETLDRATYQPEVPKRRFDESDSFGSFNTPGAAGLSFTTPRAPRVQPRADAPER